MTADLIIIKFGGSLITDKSTLCSAKIDVIENLCSMILEIKKLGNRVIIVHGAGSFGHLKAMKWRIHEGRIPELNDQLEGVEQVRDDMKTLNGLIVQIMHDYSIEAEPYVPHLHGKGVGVDYVFSNEFDKILNSNVVPVVYGDVVDSFCEKEFGILSGDDICEILTKHYNPKHVIFTIDGAEGIIDNPNSKFGGNIIKKYIIGTEIVTKEVENDVTGGMELKILRATNCLKMGSRVSIINGNKQKMIINAIQGKDFIGTEFLLNNN